jgi:hypothetical protein
MTDIKNLHRRPEEWYYRHRIDRYTPLNEKRKGNDNDLNYSFRTYAVELENQQH